MSGLLAQKPALRAEVLTYKKVLEILLLPYQYIFSLKSPLLVTRNIFEQINLYKY